MYSMLPGGLFQYQHPISVLHILQLMNLYRHIIIIQNPKFTLGFTLSVVYSMHLDKRIMTCINRYGII